MKRCFPESSLPPSSLPLSVGRMPRAQCTQNSIMFNMHYMTTSRATNWFLVWPLNTIDTGVFLLPVSLSVCLFICLSHTFLSVLLQGCIPLQGSQVNELPANQDEPGRHPFEIVPGELAWWRLCCVRKSASKYVLFKWCWTISLVQCAKQKKRWALCFTGFTGRNDHAHLI